MSVETVIQKTKEYLEVPSVIGFENPFIQYLISDFKKIPNISCQINPDYISFSTCNFSFEKPIFSAHLDRHGFLSDPQKDY